MTPSRTGVGTEVGGGRGGQRGAAAAEAGRGRRGLGDRGLPAAGTAALGAGCSPDKLQQAVGGNQL